MWNRGVEIMLEALKNTNKKLLYTIILILIIPIIIIIFLALIQSCGNRKMTYSKYEEKLILATQNYLKAKDKLPVNIGEVSKVNLDTLVKENYVKSPEEAIGDSTCKGEVYARKITDENTNYIVSIDCEKTKENGKSLKLQILDNIVSSDDGVYKVENEYVYKGEEPNNYITIGSITYRILSMDENNIVRLISPRAESAPSSWDNKYNIDVDASYGINIYEDSVIRKKLQQKYESTKKDMVELKKYIIPYKVCVGKREINNNSISRQLDCKETLENQYISLINVSDYARASLDKNCTSTIAKSCRNYNYLKNVISSSWTMNVVSNNTYQAYYISSGMLNYRKLNTYSYYNTVIYIDGNEKIVSGDGSKESPYML